MAMAREYQALTKAKFGPGGPGCRCCQPHHTKLTARRVVRRKSRQETRLLTSHPPEYEPDPWDDYLLSYDWEEDRLWGPNAGVTWRMTESPFRLVPAWVRDDAAEAYERERALWALAGEPLCLTWGVPVSLCDEMRFFLQTLVTAHDDLLIVTGCWHD